MESVHSSVTTILFALMYFSYKAGQMKGSVTPVGLQAGMLSTEQRTLT